jgi:hypothetical protein
MLAKLSSKNQITIPQKVMRNFPDIQYFDVEVREGGILLKPMEVREPSLEKIRYKIESLGLTPDSVSEAVEWARSKD